MKLRLFASLAVAFPPSSSTSRPGKSMPCMPNRALMDVVEPVF